MGEIVRVRMADLAFASSPDILITTGLGSCVGVALYDPVRQVGGLAHIMLPGEGKHNTRKPYKYSRPALDYLLQGLRERGALRSRLVAKMVGGAQMFNLNGDSPILQIGQRNIKAIHSFLRQMNIPVRGEEVGGSFARTMEFYTDDGRVLVKSFKGEDRIL